MTGTALVAAWQGALAAENEAIYAYDLIGARLPGGEQDLARSCAAAHAVVRDAASTGLLAAGAAPVPSLPDYPGLYPVPDAAAARAVAVRVEQGCATAWRYLYALAASAATASSAPSQPSRRALRSDAQAALTACAVRATRWRVLGDPAHATTPFPGIG